MLDVHLLIEGNDHYFIVREHQLDGKSMAQLNRLQQKLNFTSHTYSGGESDNHRPVSRLMFYYNEPKSINYYYFFFV